MASRPATDHVGSSWQRFPIRRIEDLRNAVLGAELEATQMAGPRVQVGLVFGASHGIVVSSGLIGGKVAVRGAPSEDAITLCLGVKLGRGSRHWLGDVGDGDVSIHLPRDEIDAIFAAGSLYIAATLTEERLKAEAERNRLALDQDLLRRTGLHPSALPAGARAEIGWQISSLHGSAIDTVVPGLGVATLRVIIDHFSRYPPGGEGRVHQRGRARIVHRARGHIRENLATAIRIRELAERRGRRCARCTAHSSRCWRKRRTPTCAGCGSTVSGATWSPKPKPPGQSPLWPGAGHPAATSGDFQAGIARFSERRRAPRALHWARSASNEWL